MKSKKIIFLTLALIIVAFSLVTNTYAWFTGAKRTGRMVFTSGEVRYELSNVYEYFIDKDEFIIPNQELVQNGKTFSIFNFSTITSRLRVKVAIGYKLDDGETSVIKYLNNQADDYVQGLMYYNDENGEGWRYVIDTENEEDSYWYYYTSTDNPVIESAPSPDMGFELKMLQSIKLNGKHYGNDVSFKEMSVIIVFQAMQSEFATWNDIGTIKITID